MTGRKKTIVFYCFIMFAFIGIVLGGREAVTVISQTSPADRNYRVVIDAGHGGIDGGAISCTGQPESVYNLQIAFALNDLMNLLGYDTVMVREKDVSVYTDGETISQKKLSDLKERVRIVNETPGSILVSIHQNYFSDNRYYGSQVFYANSDDSKRLAESLQNQLVSCLTPGSKRQIKKSNGIYLMDHIDTTGVLIECGFLSNQEEEARLRDGLYQKKLCCVIAATLSQFLSNS